MAPMSLEESGRVDERYSRQDGQLNEDRLTGRVTVTPPHAVRPPRRNS